MIDELIKISRYYGRKNGYALGGGGNTSYKTSRILWVKASGFSLDDITADGFAVLDRKKLSSISGKTYSNDPFERERQVKDDLMASNTGSGPPRRPSVEASLHNLIEHAFIVHTHPYFVNALMCSRNARQKTLSLFGKEALYVPYVDPGYILFKKIERDLIRYKSRYGTHPEIIFLQNHGVFVGAASTRKIKETYNRIFSRISKYFRKNPETGKHSFRYENLPILKDIYERYDPGTSHVFKTRRNDLINFFTSGNKNFQLIKLPFIPDQIVYCKTNPLWMGSGIKDSPREIEKSFVHYHRKHGYLPRTILVEKEGMIVSEANGSSAGLVADVFEDAMKISFYSRYFGGPHFMSPRQIRFIESWEVENYRRNLIMKSK